MKIRKRIALTLIASLLIVVTGCPRNQKAGLPLPELGWYDQCASACDNMKHLGCDEALPKDTHKACVSNSTCGDGEVCSSLGTCIVTCVSACVDAKEDGVRFDTSCIVHADKCEQVRACMKPEPKTCNENSCPIPIN